MSEPAPVIASLAAKRAQAEEAKPRKARTLLPAPPLPDGATAEELRAWASDALKLGADPLDAVQVFGHHEDSRLVLVRASGARVTFDRARDTFDSGRLVAVVAIGARVRLPPYSRADAHEIASALQLLAERLVEDDARSEAAEWGRAFLADAARNQFDVADTRTPAGRWEALMLLVAWERPADLAPDASPAERSILVRDAATGVRLIRTSDFAAHARGIAGRGLAWSALHGRMVEVGWEHRGEVHQRQPGGHARAKAHLYAVAAGWESAE